MSQKEKEREAVIKLAEKCFFEIYDRLNEKFDPQERRIPDMMLSTALYLTLMIIHKNLISTPNLGIKKEDYLESIFDAMRERLISDSDLEKLRAKEGFRNC